MGVDPFMLAVEPMETSAAQGSVLHDTARRALSIQPKKGDMRYGHSFSNLVPQFPVLSNPDGNSLLVRITMG